MKIFKELKILLGSKFNFYFYLIFFFTLIASFFDVLSIGSVGLFIGFIIEPNFLEEFSQIKGVNLFYELEYKKRIYFGCLIIFAIFVFKNLFVFTVFFAQSLFNYKLKKDISSKIFKFYLNKEFLFHLSNNPSFLWRNINEEVDNTCQYIDNISKLSGAIFLVLFIFTTLIYTSPFISYSLATFLILVTFVLIFYLFIKQNLKKRSVIRLDAAGNLIKLVEQALSSIKETILYKKQKFFFSKFKKIQELKLRQGFVINLINFFPRVAIELISIFVILSLVFFYIFNDIEINKLIAFLSFLTLSLIRLIPAFNFISSALNNMKYQKISKEIIVNEYLEIQRENHLHLRKDKDQISFDFKNNIKFEKVSFNYQKNLKMIIKDFNLEIKKGEKIAVIGASGSGKSTLINLLSGFLKPTNGEIQVDGKSIFSNISGWQNQISYIPQDIYLLDDSILENITFLDTENVDKTHLNKILELCELKEFIKSLPDKENTIIGHKGSRISGGQRQRLAIARAMYKKPKIIIMDEPTSALDFETKKKLIDKFFVNFKNFTFIFVTHDHFLLEKKFDKIVELKKNDK